MSPDWDVERIRADFPILGTSVHDSAKLVYLDNAASTQRPQCVIDALNDVYTRTYANVHRGSHWLSDQSTEGYELAREAIAKFVGAQSANEIVFTTGTTGGINLVARSWGEANIEVGDEVLLTEMEHHSNIVPWQQLSERTGCRVRFLPLLEDGRLDMEQLPNMLSESTRMFAFAAVSNVTGAINPVGELVEAARAVGATTLVDAAQAVPHQSVDFEAWGVDFAVFSGHKMLGPSGIGALYGRETLLDEMPPFLGGGSMIREVTLDGYTVAALPAKFEAGTPPIANAIVMRTTIEYLEQLDLSQVIVHERRLAQRAHEHLEQMESVRILGPGVSEKSGIVAFAIDGVHPQDLASFLDRKGIAIRAGHHCAMPLHAHFGLAASSRASFYLYNTLEEVDVFADALQRAIRLFRG
jgi:cysteine desulfurase / selenocysteine lyase